MRSPYKSRSGFDTAWRKGRVDRRAGVELSGNPYRRISAGRRPTRGSYSEAWSRAWALGWQAQDAELKQGVEA